MTKGRAEYKRQWYLKNRERVLARTKQWSEDNKERISKQRKEFREKNRERLSQENKEKYRINKEEIRRKSKEYRGGKGRETARAYRKRNREKINARANAYIKKKLKEDPSFKIAHACRGRIRRVLNGIAKSATTLTLLGCTADELKAYLESKFDSNMTWENHGIYWHIDHIIPCCSFDLTDPEQQRKCFHYTNLQPLEATANLRKNRFFTESPSSLDKEALYPSNPSQTEEHQTHSRLD